MKGTRVQYLTLGIMMFLLFILISLFPERSNLSAPEQDQSDKQLQKVRVVNNEQALLNKQ